MFANEGNVKPGYTACFGDRQPYGIDSLTKLDDFVERLGMPEQFEVGFRSNQASLSRPSQKRFPVAQQLVGLLAQVFSCRVAEIECQMSTDLMGDRSTRDKSFGIGPRPGAVEWLSLQPSDCSGESS